MTVKKEVFWNNFKTYFEERPGIAITGLIILGLAVVYGVAFLLPEIAVSPKSVPNVTDRIQLQNGIRSALLPGLAAALFLATAYFSLRQLRMTASQVAIGQRQLEVAREAQAIERFSRSVEHLGHVELEVRIGGLYSLEQLALNDKTYAAQVTEIIAAYIRGHSPWPPRLPGQYIVGAKIRDIPDLRIRAIDIQVGLDIIGHLLSSGTLDNFGSLDLSHADLRNSDLSNRKLSETRFDYSCLVGSNMHETILDESSFVDVDLREVYAENAKLRRVWLRGDVKIRAANFWGADFTDSDLLHLDLRGAELRRAKLERARLSYSDFSDASLHEADLKSADISRCKFAGAYLHGANLDECRWRIDQPPDFTNALADEETRWPHGFDPIAGGVGMTCLVPNVLRILGEMPIRVASPAERLKHDRGDTV